MNNIQLAWYRVSHKEARAHSLHGTAKVIANTLPPWNMATPGKLVFGYSIYFADKRVGWTEDWNVANAIAAGSATAEIMKHSQGRLAQ